VALTTDITRGVAQPADLSMPDWSLALYAADCAEPGTGVE
jgi:hypothetical protein